jgi:hypothetical protein
MYSQARGQVNPTSQFALSAFSPKGGCEEIRLAWWKGGRQMMRPADLDAPDWVPLFAAAVQADVFTDQEKLGMLRALLT